jgi:Fe-S-cluster containining protein
MLLSDEDIRRLTERGQNPESFVRFDGAGYAMLRNRQGCCAFYNVGEHKCNVYSFRPSGCRVYPIMSDEEKGIVIDEICPAKGSISSAEKARRGRRVLRLLEKIDSEAGRRVAK